MGRLIDADKLKLDLSKELISVERKRGATKLDMACRALEVVDESPAVDAEPVRHGHWIYDPNGMDWNIPAWICSECGFVCNHLPTVLGKKQVVNAMLKRFAGSQYCPHCGAKMDGGTDDAENRA